MNAPTIETIRPTEDISGWSWEAMESPAVDTVCRDCCGHGFAPCPFDEVSLVRCPTCYGCGEVSGPVYLEARQRIERLLDERAPPRT